MADHMKFKTARFNLKNAGERRAYAIIEANEADGVSFKQLAVIAILMREGEDLTQYLMPEQARGVTRDELSMLLEEKLAVQLEHYTDELLRQLRKRGAPNYASDDDGGDVSSFASNFARGYIQRSKGNEDE